MVTNMAPYVRAQGLWKNYSDGFAVQDLSYEVQKGEVFGLLGPNGAGKTTTLKMMAAVLDPTRGDCSVNGLDTVKEKIGVKQITGYLPEEDFLYGDMKVADHVRYMGELYGVGDVGSEVDRVLDAVDMQPQKDEVIKTLSKGQRRRVAIAKTLIHDPQLLLLDEVTAGLDPVYARRMAEVVKGLNDEGKTIVLSTHLLDEATKLCDRMLIIHEGQAKALGTQQEILEKTKTGSLEEAFFKLIE